MASSSRKRSTVYPFLRFEPNVDWQHVDPALLQKLNQLGAQKRVVIDVISGYRTPEHSVSVGGFANDPHTRGIAVDAEVNGKPVGSVFSNQQFAAAGLESGNQPGFFNGKPDPGHVQLPSSGTAAAATSSTPAATAPPPQQPAAAATPDVPAGPVGNPAPPPVDTTTAIGSAAPTVAAPTPVGSTVADLWRQVAQLPQVSPETQQLVANAQTDQGIPTGG